MKTEKFRSLTASLTSAFLALSFVTLFLAVSLELYLNFRTQQNVVASELQLITQGAANTVSGFVQQNLSVLQEATGLNDAITATPDQQELLVSKLLGYNPSFRQVFILNTEGQELREISRLAGETDPLAGNLKTDLLGQIGQGKSYISSVYIDPATSEPLVVMGVPAKDIFGDIKGALVVEVNLKFMWDLVGNLKIGKGGVAYVVDEKGDLIAFGDVGRVLAHENLAGLFEVGEFMKGVQSVSDVLPDISKGIQGNEVVSNYTALGMPDWAVVVELPVLEAYATLIGQAELSLWIVLLSSVFAAVIGIYLSKRITKPIKRLRDAAKEISGNNLTMDIDIRDHNEIGELAEAFNVMTVKIRQAYAALEKDRAQLLASINSLSLGFIMMDNRRNIIVLNQTVRDLFHADIVTFDDVENKFGAAVNIADSYRHVLESKTNCEIREIAFGDKFLRILLTPIFLSKSSREVIGLVILFEDVTEAKQLEQSKDAFLAIAAHEMRTPLTVIRGNAELLLDEPTITANTGLKAQIESVLHGAVRLLNIVNDFLDVQNLEAGKVSLHIEPVDILALLKETVQDMSVLIAQKRLTLALDIPSDFGTPVIDFDKSRLQQIYINLLSNAIHYTEQGGITISLGKKEGVVEVSFKDTGIGISTEEQGRLFRKFETGRVFLQSREYSSGLGLYISRFLAHLMGGDLVLEKSDVGKGSIFRLTLPVKGAVKRSAASSKT
jgi:signal transduction histidine kinase